MTEIVMTPANLLDGEVVMRDGDQEAAPGLRNESGRAERTNRFGPNRERASRCRERIAEL